jgi:hypothetical protein
MRRAKLNQNHRKTAKERKEEKRRNLQTFFSFEASLRLDKQCAQPVRLPAQPHFASYVQRSASRTAAINERNTDPPDSHHTPLLLTVARLPCVICKRLATTIGTA